ncbi:MAG: hypothetical protein V3S30_07410 [Thermoanaerobaculia bacterium]
MVRRDLVSYLILTLGLGVLGLFAYFTRYPDSQYLERAQAWPFVGPAVAAFRASYLPSEASLEPSARQTNRNGGTGEAIQNDASSVETVTSRAIWLGPETVFFEEPDFGSVKTARADEYVRLPIVRQIEDWYLVNRGSQMGWVYFEDYYTSDEPPLGSAPTPVVPLDSRPPHPDRLQLARLVMGKDGVQGRLGPYLLYSDARSKDLVDFCDRVAHRVEERYRARYDLRPVGEPAEAILLFERVLDYRVLQATDTTLEGLLASGHTGFGMVALWVGGRSKWEVAATLIHEITHLLNRRALGPALPAWLNEGIADDMAAFRLEESGALEATRLSGRRTRIGRAVVTGGALGAVIQLRKSLNTPGSRSLQEVLNLDWEEFVRSDPKQLNYAQSSFWIRYLLSDPQLATRFKAYLAEIAAGGDATPTALQARLGRDWAQLQQGFSTWVGLQGLEEL